MASLLRRLVAASVLALSLLLCAPLFAVDLVITAANVAAAGGASVDRSYNAGATVTAGQTVYLDSSTSTWKLAGSNSTAAAAALKGIALHASASGQPLAVQTGGTITIGATTTVGKIYVLSKNSGAIAPVDDLASGNYVTVVGYADTASTIVIGIVNTQVKVP